MGSAQGISIFVAMSFSVDGLLIVRLKRETPAHQSGVEALQPNEGVVIRLHQLPAVYIWLKMLHSPYNG